MSEPVRLQQLAAVLRAILTGETLPTDQNEPAAAPMQPGAQGCRILLVDDNDCLRQVEAGRFEDC